jgi:hypothetical protein
LHGFLLDKENGGSKFLRNIDELLLRYKEAYCGRWYTSTAFCFSVILYDSTSFCSVL